MADDLRNIRFIRGAFDHTTAGQSRSARTLRPSAARVGTAVSMTTGSFGVRRRPTAAAGGERSLEGVPEVSVKQCVDERVERRVDVADPEQNGHDDRRRFRAEFAAQRVVDVPGEEWQPAAEKRAHDDAERLGSFVLALHLSTFWSLRLCTVLHAHSRRRRRRGQRRVAVAGCGQVKMVNRRPERHGQRLNELGLSLSSAKDTPVGDNHDDRRKPE